MTGRHDVAATRAGSGTRLPLGASGHAAHIGTANRVCLAVILCLMSAPALSLEPINEEPHINESLIAGRVGDVIRNTCPTISARMFVVYRKLKDLERYARDRGYTDADFETFRNDPQEKDRMKAQAAAYLAQSGAVEGDVESYCRVGREEIARGSLIGELLRSSE